MKCAAELSVGFMSIRVFFLHDDDDELMLIHDSAWNISCSYFNSLLYTYSLHSFHREECNLCVFFLVFMWFYCCTSLFYIVLFTNIYLMLVTSCFNLKSICTNCFYYSQLCLFIYFVCSHYIFSSHTQVCVSVLCVLVFKCSRRS